MAEDVQLSSNQTEKLLQFQDLTGIEEMDRCREILQTHNWDLEVAVQDTLNMREGSPSIYRPPSNSMPTVVTNFPNQRFYQAVRVWRPQGIFGWGYFLLSFPFNFIYQSLLSIMRFAWSLIHPDPRRYVTDPLGDVLSFIQSYQSKYGPVHPVFYQGTYSQALNDAKRELKFLLIYLHGDDHQDTPYFCRTTLANQDVIAFINTRFLFWACSVNLPEGYRVSQALRENGYPFLAVIVLRDNRMTVVARLEGPVEPTELIQRLQRIMNDNETSLVAARLDRQERSLNQTIREEQDQAYLESLRADQEKERIKKEEDERKEQQEREEHEKKLAEQFKKDEIRRLKVELADQVPDEPPPNEPDTIRLMIKLPEGRRLERRFRRDHSLKYLYYFVFCHDQSPDCFQIVTNFPRRVLPCEPTRDCPEPPSFREAGLSQSEMLFVQDLDT
ncbi:fas-associated factor 2 isoform X1 [Tachypleus tridentatus]|uniref:fas-associated factor 2 isoform X1 n=2 Tax=Tachypleus tridentatus TaxID=6853 RepID=UPI003FD00AC6